MKTRFVHRTDRELLMCQIPLSLPMSIEEFLDPVKQGLFHTLQRENPSDRESRVMSVVL